MLGLPASPAHRMLHAIGTAFLFSTTALAQPQELTPQAQPVLIEAPPSDACASCCRGSCSVSQVLRESVFGCADEWTPLCFNQLFSTGWCDAYAEPPRGPGGAPRQTWLNTFDGFLNRQVELGYGFTRDLQTVDERGDAHLGFFSIETPLNRRVSVRLDVPFVVALDSYCGCDHTDFGDITVTPKVLLYETCDTSITAGLSIRTPTGEPETGGKVGSLFPHVAAWRDLGCGWSFHGGTGIEVETDSPPNSDDRTVWVTSLAVGQTITPHCALPIGDFTYYLATNIRTDLASDCDNHTLVTLSPGIRTHLGCNYYFLAAYEFPVTGPEAYDQRFLVALIKTW